MKRNLSILSYLLLCMSFPAQGKDMDISMKVHLGNIRAVVSQNDSIEEINHYYPYGSLFGESTGLSNETQPYKYTGKELDRMHGLDLHDHGARWSDTNLGRWHKIDPLTENDYNTSPYVLCNNNPVKYTDQNGEIWDKPKEVERLIKKIQQRISQLKQDNEKMQEKIGRKHLSDKKIAKTNSKIRENIAKVDLLIQSLTDIKNIDSSKEVFSLAKPSTNDGTHRVVKSESGIIKIEGSPDGLHIHEIRHVGQSLNKGGLRFNKSGQLKNVGTNKEAKQYNEINAYQTQYSFDGSFPGTISSLNDINNAALYEIKTETGKHIYEDLFK